MPNNMDIYNCVRAVPKEAQRPIQAGRLKGMTDINPQFRIQTLTECFGPCGIGWMYSIEKQWTETGAGGEIAAFVNINLYICDPDSGEWSKPIPGTGGSLFVAAEKAGLHTSDECYKMALTDAISVACKALGIGADVYWAAGRTKYSQTPAKEPDIICEACGKPIAPVRAQGKPLSAAEIAERSRKAYQRVLCYECCKKAAMSASGGN